VSGGKGSGAARAGAVGDGTVELSYRVDGPAGAPVLVLGGSLGTTLGLWDPQMAAFTDHFRVLRFNLPGHGGSAAPPGPYTIAGLAGDVLALADGLGVDRFSYCGISLGGMVGMWLAAHHPERVDRLVLAATAPVLGPPEGWTDRAATVRRDGTGTLVGTLLGRWLPDAYRDARPDVVAEVAAMIGGCDREGYAGCCEAIATMDQRPDLASIGAPTLVVAGAEDPATPPATCLALAQAVPGAALCCLPGAAHLVNLPHPERFAALVVDHVAGPAAGRGMAVRRSVLGDAHVDRATAGASAFSAPFQDLVTRYAWGEIWSRPALDRRTKSAVTLAMLVALGRTDELSFHVPAAVRNGLGPDEIREVLLQSAVYAGVPAAREAFLVAERVLGGEA
jgi:3-oxoadipate enol-lactonase/4-carboxymuconolactone decarboxylase